MDSAGPPRLLLFVCVENSNRSQMAEAFALMHAGHNVRAYSAGSAPSGTINSQAIKAMRERGYDLTRHRSKSLAAVPDIEYDLVVTMGCGDRCPFVRAKKRQDWEVPDPSGLPPERFREIRDLIEAKVLALLENLDLD